MKKTLPLFISLCCIGASATANNYDLLGRRGSQMNSPMVYKNVDYLKTKQQQQQEINAPVETHSLQKMGLSSGVGAIEGAYRSTQGNFYFRKFPTSGNPSCSGTTCLSNWSNYKTKSNESFITINETQSTPSLETAGWSHFGHLTNHTTPNYNYNYQQSPYPTPATSTTIIEYQSYPFVKTSLSRYSYVNNWFDNRASKVGVFIGTDGLPAKISTAKDVKFKRTNNNDTFKDGPGYEVRESRAYSLIKDASTHTTNGSEKNHTVVYVGSTSPSTPASKSPQIYMGLRNDKMGYSSTYNANAKNLDNFIYQNRTLEFVPAGNDAQRPTDNTKYISSYAHSANAIAVGAVNAFNANNPTVTPYTSTKTHTNGSTKPEIYNFSDFMKMDYTEHRRDYHYGANDYTYQPYYDGTEAAAAYTAGMVANFLAVNPFYRWHPEVVKAFLLSADGRYITGNTSSLVTNTLLSYEYLVFDYTDPANYNYDSRYWNGDINKLKTRTVNNKPEIWFVMENVGNVTRGTRAAISWLSSGDDIANNNGKVPQDIDLFIYGSSKTDYECLVAPDVDLNNPPACHGHTGYFSFDDPGSLLGSSASSLNSFEKTAFASNYKYLVVKIQLWGDNSSSANKGQIAVGFNAAASRY